MNGTFEVHYYGYNDPLMDSERDGLRYVPHVAAAPKRRKSNFVPSKPSPAKGVSFDKARNKWQAYVGGGKTRRIKLGRFDTAEQASKTVKQYNETH